MVTQCRMRALPKKGQDSFLCLDKGISTGDDDGYMSYVKAFDLSGFVVDFSDHVLVDMHGRKGEQPNEEFQRKREIKRNIGLVIILVMTITTQIFSIISDRLS